MAALDAIKSAVTFLTGGKGGWLSDTLTAVDSVLGVTYTDGVSNTRYGIRMEETWVGTSTSFLDNFKYGYFDTTNTDSYKVNFLDTTPLDPQGGASSIFGNLILGTPPLYTQKTDPNNRTMINTFLKDSMILSLTPGLPKYNGGQYNIQNLLSTSGNNNYTKQNANGQEMLDYVLKNGLDKTFASKDKRYYIFEPKFGDYYSYLETMLNTLWLKMGLGVVSQSEFDMYTFFNIKKSATELLTKPSKDSDLIGRYKSSLGFFVNVAGHISESVNNETFSSNLESEANEVSDAYQKLGYLTGMGTSSKADAVRRAVGVGLQTYSTFKSQVTDKISADLSGGIVSSALSIAKNIADFSTNTDMSSLVQSFMVSNGMKVMYPQLWSNSMYSKNINISFNFVSPYGDPLSIFQYVYVPFFALMTFVLPRQAAENGFVSPFFVRADVPGLITSDLAIITDLTWTKGGEAGDLWTKDRLPRAISGSFTITDLYPYLAMVKRFSFLSANPSYTVFLDNMAGLGVNFNGEDASDSLNEYWNNLINRVSGDRIMPSGSQNYLENQSLGSTLYSSTLKDSVSKTINRKAVPWLK